MNSTQSTEHLMTPNQVAEMLGVSRRTIDRWSSRRIIPFVRLGTRKYYRKPAVLNAIRKKEVESK